MMRVIKIAVEGDAPDEIMDDALGWARDAVESQLIDGKVYRAWVEEINAKDIPR